MNFNKGIFRIIIIIVLSAVTIEVYAQNGVNQPVENMFSREDILQVLFPNYHPETKTIAYPETTEYIVISDIQEWTCLEHSLVALIVTSFHPEVTLYSFLDSSPPKESYGKMGIFVLQKDGGQFTCIARHMTEMCFADTSGYKANEIELDVGPYMITDTECAIGVRIVSTPTIAKGQEILTLYKMNEGELQCIFDEVIGFSDRVHTYESILFTSKTKTDEYFNLIQRMNVESILSDGGGEKSLSEQETLYTWNSERQQYEESSLEKQSIHRK